MWREFDSKHIIPAEQRKEALEERAERIDVSFRDYYGGTGAFIEGEQPTKLVEQAESGGAVGNIINMLKFEEKFNLSVATLAKSEKLTHIVFLAWAALSRTKQTDKNFEDFIETVSAVSASEIDPK